MNITEQLRNDIEAAAAILGVAPSTVGERAGQGGHFYARLCNNKRVWPETADAVRARISEMLAHAEKHGNPAPTVQPDVSGSEAK